MFKTGCYYINPAEVSLIYCCKSSDNCYPYGLRVTIKGGESYQTNYKSEQLRDYDADVLSRQVGLYDQPPVSKYEVQSIVQRAVDTVRRDIRDVKKRMPNEETKWND